MKSLQFLKLGIIFFGINTIAHALVSPTPLTDDLYVGISADLNQYSIKNRFIFNPDNVNNASTYNISQGISTHSINPGLLIGYQKEIHDYVFGIQFKSSFTNISRSSNTEDLSTNQFKFGTTYYFDLKAGYEFYPTIIGYGLLGIQTTLLQRNIEFAPDSNYASIGVAPTAPQKRVWGGNAGLGLMHKITDNWYVAGEYTYDIYSSTNYNLENSIFKFLGVIATNKINLSQNAASIVLIYKI